MAEKKLRILVIGASGTVGRAAVSQLGQRHEIVTAGRSAGRSTVKMDISDVETIKAGLKAAGPIDAVVCCAGNVKFPSLSDVEANPLKDSIFKLGIEDKLMGQINLALEARKYLKQDGSITLISGIVGKAEGLIRYGACASAVNGALEGFVRSAALEMPTGLRINIVSPTVLTEALPGYGPFFRGFKSVSSEDVGLAFCRSVEGIETGKVYPVGY